MFGYCGAAVAQVTEHVIKQSEAFHEVMRAQCWKRTENENVFNKLFLIYINVLGGLCLCHNTSSQFVWDTDPGPYSPVHLLLVGGGVWNYG